MIQTPKLHSIGILYNPISGSGEALDTANALQKLLIKQGYTAHLIQSQPKERKNLLFEPLQRLDALIALGGDGTMLCLLDILLELQLPIYLMPFGNECLFSKEFKMSKKPSDVLKVIKKNTIVESYVALANNESFLTMISIGFDSKVVEHIIAKRTGPINKLDYAFAILKKALKHRPPKITLQIEGKEIISEQKGFLIISNSKQYALQIPFCPQANSLKKELSACFIPYQNSFSFIYNCVLLMMGKTPKNHEHYQGEVFEISIDKAYPAQIDGDLAKDSKHFSVHLKEKKLQVLCS